MAKPPKNNSNPPFKEKDTSVVYPRTQNGTQVVTQHTQHVTTIFDPDVLKRYAEMVPDAPERVLRVFEQNSATERTMREALASQQLNQNALQARMVELQASDNKRRDWMAFLIILAGLVTSAVFAYLEKPYLSGGALVAIIAYAVIGFLQKTKKPAKE